MSSSPKLTPEMRRLMLADADDPERRGEFLPPRPGAPTPEENLERLWALLYEMEPFLTRLPVRRGVFRGGKFVL